MTTKWVQCTVYPSESFLAHMSHMSSATVLPDAPSRDVIARFGKGTDVAAFWGYVAAAKALPGCSAAAVGYQWELHPFIEAALQEKDNCLSLLKDAHTPGTCYLYLIYRRSTSRLPLLTMETYSSSHKKQKLSNTAENWVSVGTCDVLTFRRAAAPTSSTHQLPVSLITQY